MAIECLRETLPIGNVFGRGHSFDKARTRTWIQFMKTTTTTGCNRNQARIIAKTSVNEIGRLENTQLSKTEKNLLQSHEQTIVNGLATFFEVGSALMEIKRARLYRESYHSFESYCQERWGFGKTYAWRVIGAAERLKLLPDGTPCRPSNEFQIRPFLKLAPEAFPKMWNQVVERARDGRITSKLISGLIDELDDSRQKHRHRATPKIVLAKGTVGEIIVLLDQAKRQLEIIQSEDRERTIELLDRIEKLLF